LFCGHNLIPVNLNKPFKMDYKYINPDYIESVSGGDIETIRELVSIFNDQVAEFSLEMLNLLRKGDHYNLGLLAHKAKSSVAIMGMEDLAVMLKKFELEAKENRETGNYATYVERFGSETRGAVAELGEYVSKL
jgi:HPt (histidine-containing phosphotransfer) domain-containing protein